MIGLIDVHALRAEDALPAEAVRAAAPVDAIATCRNGVDPAAETSAGRDNGDAAGGFRAC